MVGVDSAVLPHRVLCIGSPLLEVHAEVPLGFLERYGLSANAAVQLEERHKPQALLGELRGQGQQGDGLPPAQHAAGGSAAMTALCISGLLKNGPLSSHGEPLVALLGGIGRDDFGTRLRRLVEDAGVLALFSDSDVAATGWRAVLQVQGIVPSRDSVGMLSGESSDSLRHPGQVTAVTHTGAAREYKLDHLRFKVWEMVEAHRIVYIDALFLTVSIESVKYVAEHCAKMGNTFCLNLSAPHMCRFFHDRVLTLLPYADYVFGNEAEYIALAEHRKDDAMKDIDSVVTWLAKLPRVDGDAGKRRAVVVTCGQHPTIVGSTWRGYGVKIRRYSVPPVRPGRYMTKDGAGDAFVGGFVYALMHESDVDTCVQLALYAAHAAVQRVGPQLIFKDQPPLDDDPKI